MKKFKFIFTLLLSLVLLSCDYTPSTPVSDSGIKKASADVTVQANGLTVEQENILNKYEQENMPGAIKHLYVISAYSGDVIIYSTVDGKVTSSGKRLTPITLGADGAPYASDTATEIIINKETYYTQEVIQDDGTYGSSTQYLYWTDTKGVYHQHYVAGGQILHVSSQPLSVGKIIINMELIE